MSVKSFKNSFYSRQKGRRFGWFSVILAITANVLIFLSISWVNRVPAGHPSEDYTVIELFKPELALKNILPEIDSRPVIVETRFQPRPEPMKLIRSKETLVRPRLIEWMPDSLQKKPGVGIDISLTEISSPELVDISDIGDALALNQVDQPPYKISGNLPLYPIWARAKKAEGSVILRFIVGLDGKAHNIEVHSIRGDERFAMPAQKSVEKWRFEPAVNRGKSVAVWCFQKIQFQFEE
jgi:TonB family protein